MVATWTAVSRVNQSKKTRRKRQEPARQKAWMEGATHRLGFVIVVTVDGRAGWSRRRPGRRRRRFCPARVGCEHKAGGAPWGSQRILPNERQRLRRRRRMADGRRGRRRWQIRSGKSAATAPRGGSDQKSGSGGGGGGGGGGGHLKQEHSEREADTQPAGCLLEAGANTAATATA